MSSGAWAELVAVPTVALAELPETVSFTDAATLPVAGLTALYALERGGNLLGRTVLVTGASGGAGDFALRLGSLSGGRIVALVRRAEHEPIAREAGAHEVAVGEGAKAAEGFGPYDLILDSVGGAVLGEALSMLAPGGSCVAFGGSAAYNVTFDVRDFYLTGGASVHGFILFHEVLSRPASAGLARLASLVADRRLALASRSRHRGRRSERSRVGYSTGTSPARPSCTSRVTRGGPMEPTRHLVQELRKVPLLAELHEFADPSALVITERSA